MTVPNQTPIAIYVADGVTASYTYPFEIVSEDDLTVTLDGAPPMIALTITGIGESEGEVVFATAPAAGTVVVLYRSVELERNTDYQTNGDLLAEVLNADFDRIWMSLQDQGRDLSRALVVPRSDLNPQTTLPSARQRANKALGFDNAGNPFAIDLTIGSVLAPVVHSVAMLRLVSRLLTTDVFSLGFYRAGDGGAGNYFKAYDVAPAGWENGCTQIVAADGAGWQLAVNGRLSVKQCGAKGDGLTDDTAAIVRAIATGLKVFFPVGTYVMSNTVFTTGMTLEGEGKFKASIRWATGSAESSLFEFSNAAFNISISNLTIDSNQQNQTDSTGYYGAIGGSLAHGARLNLNEIAFINGRISDVYLSGPTGQDEFASVSIRKCLFTNGLVGSATRATQAIGLSDGIALDFSNNQMIQPTAPASYGRGGLVVQRTPGSTSLSFATVSVKDNYFLNFGLSGSNVLGCVYIYSGAEQVIISGNESKNSYGAAYCAKADSGNVVIANNSVVNHYDPSVAAIVFFNQAVSYTSSIGLNLVIEGNVVKNPQSSCIFVDGARVSLSNFGNVIVANNICYGGAYGIRYRNVSNIRVSGNIVNASTTSSIFAESQIGDCTISGNTVASGVVGVDINGTTDSARMEISRNFVSALTGPAIRIRTSVESFTIEGNDIVGCTSAFVTSGATQTSAIRHNNVRGETSAWDKSGTYAGLQYENNITSVSVGFSTRSLAISSGAITVFADWHYVDTDSGASASDLNTINGTYDGRKITLFCAAAARVVTLRNGVGNLKLASDFPITKATSTITLMARGGNWYEMNRSTN